MTAIASRMAHRRSVALGREATLRELMETWRLRLDPVGFRQVAGIKQCRRHVSQEAIAAAIGVTTTWYGTLERGRLDRRYSEDFLEKVAEVLKLCWWERRMLFMLVLQREPPSSSTADHAAIGGERALPAAITPAIHATLNVQPWPAYIVDGAYELLAWNTALEAWFPELPTVGNVMRWMLCHPSARRQLPDWEDDVGRRLAQLRSQHVLLPECTELRDLILEILDSNELAARLWGQNPEVWPHEDGEHRTVVRNDTGQTVHVEVVSWMPFRQSLVRGYAFCPSDLRNEHIPGAVDAAVRDDRMV